jgi:molybdopterin converting factor small subunit
MVVTVKLFASLSRFAPGGLPGTPFELEIPPSTSLRQLADRLSIPVEEMKVAFVNGLICDLEQSLKSGDEIGFFPPVGGGSVGGN